MCHKTVGLRVYIGQAAATTFARTVLTIPAVFERQRSARTTYELVDTRRVENNYRIGGRKYYRPRFAMKL